MQRVLDIDLDFFVYNVVYWTSSEERPDGDHHPVWPVDEALTYLREQCGLVGPLPGFVTQNHGQLFSPLLAVGSVTSSTFTARAAAMTNLPS